MNGNDPIDILDAPILFAGCPPDDQDHAPWHGAMTRFVVTLLKQDLRQDHPPTDWNHLRHALDILSQHIATHILPAGKPRYITDNPDDVDNTLSRGCPPDDDPEAQHRWADTMAMCVLGFIVSVAAQADWDEHLRALASFTTFIRSDRGPLTWTT